MRKNVWSAGDGGRGEGSRQQVVCCRARDETGGLDLK